MSTKDDQEPHRVYPVSASRKLRFLIPLTVAFAFLMEQLDSTIITTAIPEMARSLGETPLRLNLAITSYILSLAVFIPVSGWIADRYGTRRVFTLSLAIFTASSVLCGLSGNFGMLLAARVLQGFGGAMMTPVGRLILLRAFPRSELVTAMSYMTLPVVIGPTMGPILGGFLTTYASWRWIFWVNVPVGCLGIAFALRYVENVREEGRTRFDFPGFLLCAFGLFCLQYGLETVGRTTPALITVALVGASVAFLAGYAIYAKGRENPAVDMTLFRVRSFAVGTLAGGLSRIGVNAVPFLLPLMLQVAFGLSPVESGSLTFVVAAGTVIVRPISGRLLRQFGFDRVLLWNAVFCAVVIAGFSLLTTHTPHWIILLYVALFGLVRSTQFMTTNTLAYADMPAALLSRSTSLGGVLQQLSVSFGVSVGATLLRWVAGSGQALTPSSFQTVFLLIALVPLASVAGFLKLRPEDGMQVSGHQRGAA
jgi:EmrB/QacA subfamily drug resistance transporter